MDLERLSTINFKSTFCTDEAYFVQRCNSSSALQMAYFSNKPAPSRGESLPLPSNIAKRDLERPHKRKHNDNEANPFAKKLIF